MRTPLILLAAAVAISAIACGGSSTPAATKSQQPVIKATIPVIGATSTPGGVAAALDACTIVPQTTAAQLTAATGIAKVGGSTSGVVSQCIYVDTTTGATAFVMIETFPELVSAAAMQAGMAQASHDSSSGQPITGLGDQAFKQVESSLATVAFAKRSTLVIISASSSSRTGAAIEPDLESLCQQIAGRL